MSVFTDSGFLVAGGQVTGMALPRRALRSRSWFYVLVFAAFAYSFHKVGATLGFYSRFWWFQIVAHYLSAAGVALVLARVGLDARLRGRRLDVFVAVLAALGALGWEVVEYLAVFPFLHFWGVEDMTIDLAADALGVGTVLLLLRTRIRAVLDPAAGTPTLSSLVAGRDGDSDPAPSSERDGPGRSPESDPGSEGGAGPRSDAE